MREFVRKLSFFFHFLSLRFRRLVEKVSTFLWSSANPCEWLEPHSTSSSIYQLRRRPLIIHKIRKTKKRNNDVFFFMCFVNTGHTLKWAVLIDPLAETGYAILLKSHSVEKAEEGMARREAAASFRARQVVMEALETSSADEASATSVSDVVLPGNARAKGMNSSERERIKGWKGERSNG